MTREEASNDVKMCVIFQFCGCVIEMRQFFIIQENKQIITNEEKIGLKLCLTQLHIKSRDPTIQQSNFLMGPCQLPPRRS